MIYFLSKVQLDRKALVTKTTTDIDRLVGARLREFRLARGFSQEKLGELLGVTFQQVQKYEKGTNRIAVATLQRILEVLGVSLDDLLTIDGPEPQTVDTDARQLFRLYADMSPPMRSRVMRIVELCAMEPGHH